MIILKLKDIFLLNYWWDLYPPELYLGERYNQKTVLAIGVMGLSS